MDAFELLKKDHKSVSKLFSEIESASGQEKMKVFGRLKAELDLHAHIEETVLYPALENTDEAREITLEAYEEHKVVKDLLGELANAGAPDDEWDAKLTVLKENVEHHVEEEEGELFSKARRALGQSRIDQLGTELEAEKARKTGANVKRQADAGAEPAPPAKAKPAKTESPGVLQRIANLVGLGDSRSSGSAKTPATRSKKAAGQSKARPASTKSSTKTAGKKTSTRAKAAKPAPKAAARKSASTTRSSSKASTSRSSSKATKSSSKKKASNVSRTSATKTASRGASNQKVKAASKKGRASKSSTKGRSKSR